MSGISHHLDAHIQQFLPSGAHRSLLGFAVYYTEGCGGHCHHFIFTQTSRPAADAVLEPDVKHHNGESCADKFEEDSDSSIPTLLER